MERSCKLYWVMERCEVQMIFSLSLLLIGLTFIVKLFRVMQEIDI